MLKRSSEVLRRGGVELPDEMVPEPEAAREAEDAAPVEEPAAKAPPDQPAETPAKPTGKQPAVPATVSMRALHDH
jgi:hypothetical protein